MSIKANKNIHTKNAIPRETSDDLTKDDIKKAIPKKAELKENRSPVYNKNISQGISAPILIPYITAKTIAKKTGKKTVINRPRILPQ